MSCRKYLPRLSRVNLEPLLRVRRVLCPVAVLDGGGVLVPVGEQRIVLRPDQLDPSVEDPQDVAHVAGVLQRRPDLRCRADGRVRAGEDLRPRCGLSQHEPGQIGDVDVRGDEAALRARLVEDERPVLVLGIRLRQRCLHRHRIGRRWA